MRPMNRCVTLVVAVLLAPLYLYECASESTQEGTGGQLDDTFITTKVKTAILNDPTLSSAEINAETFKGTAQLSGFVSSQADINKAVEPARGVKGVTSVKNAMRLK